MSISIGVILSFMKIEEWLKKNTRLLTKAGIATARLDTLVLLEDLLHTARTQLLAHDDKVLTSEQLKKLDEQISRRAHHEPLAYIRGKSEFYGREFLVTKDTLEPRPETETMVELLKKLRGPRAQGEGLSLVDIGTGSGCIAITAKLEFPDAQVIATDISEQCLKIAKQNAQKLGADIKFLQGDLLKPLSALLSEPWALLCNLPYVPDSHTINESAMFEPKLAIFGGPDGLDLYRRLFSQIKNANNPYDRMKSYRSGARYVLTESLPFQHEKLTKIAEQSGYTLVTTDDFIQVFAKG